MKPGIKTIIAGVVLFIFGAFLVPLLIILPIILEKSKAVQFKVPGTQEVKIEKPGRYYLWNDFQTVYDGKSYNRSKSIPDGMEIKIQDSAGTLLDFVSDTSISSSDNGSSKNSIGYVEVENIGQIKVDVSGGDEERIFSFGRSGLLKMFVLILGGVGLSILVSMGGVGIGIWGIVKLVKSNKKGSG